MITPFLIKKASILLLLYHRATLFVVFIHKNQWGRPKLAPTILNGAIHFFLSGPTFGDRDQSLP